MTDELDDLRRETRKISDKDISVKFVNKARGNKEEHHVCRSQDISAGGLKLISHRGLALGTIIPMEIDLGELWAVIEVKAEVKWCLEIDNAPTFYIGVKLLEIDKSHRQVWQKFIEKL